MVQARGMQHGSAKDKQSVENVVYRQSMLLSPEDFSVIFDKLESSLGHCAGWYAVDAPDATRLDDGLADT